MPDSQYFGDALVAAVQAGQVPASRITDMYCSLLPVSMLFCLGIIAH